MYDVHDVIPGEISVEDPRMRVLAHGGRNLSTAVFRLCPNHLENARPRVEWTKLAAVLKKFGRVRWSQFSAETDGQIANDAMIERTSQALSGLSAMWNGS
jgi:hypothetical protein